MTTVEHRRRFDQLFDLVGDPAVEIELIDRVPVVRRVNPAFEDVFGYDRGEIRGESLNRFIVPDEHDGEARRFDRRTSDGKHNTGLVTRETADGPREFFYRGVPYERGDARYGFAIYTDVTEHRRVERHLQVVHRLLRHDLRNSLQVVLAAGNRLVEEADAASTAELGARIVDHAEHLRSAGEQARIIERVLSGDHDSHPVDVATLCRDVADAQAAGRPAATITVDAPGELRVRGIDWLEEAIAALVENGAVHGGDTPTVRVSARQCGDQVELAVADDGPGIPPRFRKPVFDDHEITDLRHNRGISLWVVSQSPLEFSSN